MTFMRPNAWTAAGARGALMVSLCLFVVTAAAPKRSNRAEMADLAWITGHWVGEAFGGEIEENWLAPASESLSGQFRLIRDGAGAMYELLLIERDDDGEIYYRFKHVLPGWEPMEAEPLEYHLTSLEGRKATFRSTASEPPPNAPWWFTYASPTDDRLIVSIFGAEGTDPDAVLTMTRR